MKYVLSFVLLFSLSAQVWGETVKIPKFIKIDMRRKGVDKSKADLNLDGKYDFFEEFDGKYNLVKRQQDRNYDGVIDKITTYSEGKIEIKYRNDYLGKPDVIEEIIEKDGKVNVIIKHFDKKSRKFRIKKRMVMGHHAYNQQMETQDTKICSLDQSEWMELKGMEGLEKLFKHFNYENLPKDEYKINVEFNERCAEKVWMSEKKMHQTFYNAIRKGISCLYKKVGTPKAREHIAKFASLLKNEEKPIKYFCNWPSKKYDLANEKTDWIASAHDHHGYRPAILFNPNLENDDWRRYKKAGQMESIIFHELMHLIDPSHIHYRTDQPDYTTACSECCFEGSESSYLQAVSEDEAPYKNKAMCKFCGMNKEEYGENELLSFLHYSSFGFIRNYAHYNLIDFIEMMERTHLVSNKLANANYIQDSSDTKEMERIYSGEMIFNIIRYTDEDLKDQKDVLRKYLRKVPEHDYKKYMEELPEGTTYTGYTVFAEQNKKLIEELYKDVEDDIYKKINTKDFDQRDLVQMLKHFDGEESLKYQKAISKLLNHPVPYVRAKARLYFKRNKLFINPDLVNEWEAVFVGTDDVILQESLANVFVDMERSRPYYESVYQKLFQKLGPNSSEKGNFTRILCGYYANGRESVFLKDMEEFMEYHKSSPYKSGHHDGYDVPNYSWKENSRHQVSHQT
jgi:hypothetical protein